MRYCEAEAAALQDLKHSTKIVALILAARTSDNTADWPGRYVSFPSIDTLVRDTGLQKRSLYYALNELADANIIRIYKDRRPGARWDHNVYEWTATESPNYKPDWKKTVDQQQDAVGSRLTDEGWEYCRTHNVGPNIAAERNPGFVLPQTAPSVIEVEDPREDHAEQPALIDTPKPDTRTAAEDSSPQKKAKKTARSTAIPEDWTPSEKCLTYAREHYPSMPISVEAENFRDYYLSTGTKRIDWDATWRTWCRKGNIIAKGAWAHPPTLGVPQGAPAINPATGKPVTRDDFGYACLDMGIDPNLYIKFWKPHMGLPSDPGWPTFAAEIDRHCGRA